MIPSTGPTKRSETRRGMDAVLHKSAVEGLIEVLVERTADVLPEGIRFLPNRGGLTSQVTATGNTVLHLHVGVPASESGIPSTKFIQAAVDLQGSLLFEKNDDDEIPLHLAARFGHVAAVKVFINRARRMGDGVVRDMLLTKDRNQDTALHLAARWNNFEIASVLLSVDDSCRYGRNIDDETPLYIAAERKYHTLVAKILDTCRSPAYGGPLGRTALHAAALREHEGMLAKILEKDNSLVRSQDDEGQTPLHYAARAITRRTRGPSQSINVMLQYDDDTISSAVCIQDKEGRTALHLAALYGDVPRIKALVEHRPDCIEIRDTKGRNLFHYAAISGNLHTVIFLMRRATFGKLINEKDQEGNTPLDMLAASLRYSPLSCFLCLRAFSLQKDVYSMVFDSQNQTAGHTLRSLFPLTFRPNPGMICRSNIQVVSTVLRASLKTNTDEYLSTSMIEKHKNVVLGLKKSCEVHLIGATVIATVSLAAGIAVPCGFSQVVGDEQDSALLRRKTALVAFMVSDALALTFSTAAVLSFFHIALSQEPNIVRLFFLFSLLATALSVGATVVAFITGTYAILYQSPFVVAVSLAFTSVFTVYYVIDLCFIVEMVCTFLKGPLAARRIRERKI